MIDIVKCEFFQWRSLENEAFFFSHMGRFFASPNVRRACGGYPLNDGPRYRWFIAVQEAEPRVLGFISIEECADLIQIRAGYIRPEVRGMGLFRKLRNLTLNYIVEANKKANTRVLEQQVPYWEPLGFRACRRRGAWITLEKTVDDR